MLTILFIYFVDNKESLKILFKRSKTLFTNEALTPPTLTPTSVLMEETTETTLKNQTQFHNNITLLRVVTMAQPQYKFFLTHSFHS